MGIKCILVKISNSSLKVVKVFFIFLRNFLLFA